MKKNDYLGGVVIFAIMFTIAFIELHLFKNVNAFKSSKKKDKDKTSSAKGGGDLWAGIGVPSRLQPIRNVTITGKVVGVKPHYAPDGDMVFAFKPDPPNDSLVNDKNRSQKKMGGGLWIEAICQKENKSDESWHEGDCERGGPFPKFSLPSLGDRMSITGMYTIDVREGGHAEIHPVTQMSKI